MTTYGLTATGFVRKHLEDCAEDLEAALRVQFGLPSDYVFQTNDVLEKISSVVAESNAELWELAEAVHNAFAPSLAAGISLDNCLDMIGIARNPATRSTVFNTFIGLVGSTIDIGSLVRTTTGNKDQFRTKAACTLAASECVAAEIVITAPTNGKTYTVTVDGTPYIVTANGADTISTIRAAIKALIEAALISNLIVSEDSTDKLYLWKGVSSTPLVYYSNPEVFTISVNSSLTLLYVGNSVEMEAVNPGPVPAAALELTELLEPITGIVSTYNGVSATLGTYLETDAAARIRRAESLSQPGGCTVEGCRARLLELDSVVTAIVLENITDTVDANGLLPHSIHAVVAGGTDADIADELWNHGKGAGIATNGTTSVTVVDSMGYSHVMKFSRPTEKKMWVRLVYTTDPEDPLAFPSTGEADMKVAAKASGDLILGGRDVLPLVLEAAVEEAVQGIRTLIVRLAEDDGGSPGDYQSSPFVIDFDEYATFDLARMELVVG
jgi:hypothetical protein